MNGYMSEGLDLRSVLFGEHGYRSQLGETLRTTLAWAIEQVTEKSRNYDHVVAKLRLT